MPLTILLIDDDADGPQLSARLQDEGYRVVEARSASAGRERLRGLHVDHVIASTTLFPAATCQEVAQEIRRSTPERTPVVLLTHSGDLRSCRTCPHVRQGRLDCVDTPAAPTEVVSRLSWLRREGTPKPAPPARTSPLTPREQDVLRLLRAGMANQEIAARLFIAAKVVEKHVANLCQKLDVANRTEAVALSYRQPLFSPSRPPE